MVTLYALVANRKSMIGTLHVGIGLTISDLRHGKMWLHDYNLPINIKVLGAWEHTHSTAS